MSGSWISTFFDYCRDRVASEGALPEDERSTDWRFLLPLEGAGVALVLNPGLGTLVDALASAGTPVIAVSRDPQELGDVLRRCAARGLSNVLCVQAAGSDLPFLASSFGLIAAGADDDETTVTDVASVGARFLRPGGHVCTLAQNPITFVRGRRSGARATMGGIRRAFASGAFEHTSVFAVLPTPDAPPHFWVPLDEPGPFEYFLRNLADLFETVSPEVRRRYALKLLIARAGLRVALGTGLTTLAARFVPAFGVIARRTA